MRKTTLSILAAGVLAVAGLGVAQAETFDSPMQAGEMSTMTQGQPNQLTTNSPYSDNQVIVDTTILGAGPVLTSPSYVIVEPMTVTPIYGVVVPNHAWNDSSFQPGAYSASGSMYYGN